MMKGKNISYSLNLKNIKRISFDKYPKDFVFIVNDKRYETSRILADIISPTIMKYHYQDETLNEYVIKSDKDDYFQEFLDLISFESFDLDDNRRDIFGEYFLLLGNIDEYFQLHSDIFDKCNTSNVIDQILIKKKTIKNGCQNAENIIDDQVFSSSYFQKLIEFCAENFAKISKEQLFKLDPFDIEQIIKNEHLKLNNEDQLLKFIIDLYEIDNKNSFLFEYVYLNQVGIETLSNFIEKFSIENINEGIWKKICLRLTESNEIRPFSKEIIEIKHEKGQDCNGIMKYLGNKTGGNIHDNGTIEITANSIYNNNSSYNPRALADFSHAYQANGMKILLQFDFKDREIQLTGYTIHTNGSRNLRNWVIEVSNNLLNWTIIDERSNDTSLSNENTILFNIQNIGPFSRYIRLRETGPNSSNDYYTFFYSIEFFGKMKQLK